ncbi:MAG: hypothetical protein DDT31_01242 [Syntrophomonadaceae bacterium]|nr:hypothetical protein [Bacillota bacterium]MBT9138668.1 hypothetical protein [Bacillota bacterium]MBT9148559.1 hypothetical protein [Bacillota bacterium]
MKQMVLGISSRNYEEAIESFVSGYGIKKSSISRHFIKATAEQMREFMERDLFGTGALCNIYRRHRVQEADACCCPGIG